MQEFLKITKIALLVGFGSFFLFASQVALAQTTGGVYIPTTGETGLSDKPVKEMLIDVAKWVTSIIAILALLIIIIAGIMYMTSGGDQGRVDTAKRMLLYAVIGLIVALLGYVIVNVIADTLGAGA